MKPPLSIRLAEAGDAPAVVAFNRAMARETENKDLPLEIITAGVEAVFHNPGYGFYVVAECAGQVVGCLMITCEWSDWRNKVFWWIQSVYIQPDFRRQGIYRNLYQYVKEKAAQEGNICGFRLYVEKANAVAQQTYRNLGMHQAQYDMYEEMPAG